ncbi:MAG: DUF4845 domain-containing protein [Pseudomonadota bacterium]
MQKQTGITMIGMAVLLAILAVIVLIALKLTPIYIDSYKINAVMKDVVNERTEDGSRLSKEDIRKRLERRFDIEDVSSVSAEDFDINADKGKTSVSVQYEVRRPVAFNIDVVVKFDKKAEAGN